MQYAREPGRGQIREKKTGANSLEKPLARSKAHAESFRHCQPNGPGTGHIGELRGPEPQSPVG